jgi:hypothetical protein
MKGLLTRLARRVRRGQPFRRAQGDPKLRLWIFAFLLQRAREVWGDGSHRLRSLQRLLSPKWSHCVALGRRILRYIWLMIQLINQINDFRRSIREIAELLDQALQMLP